MERPNPPRRLPLALAPAALVAVYLIGCAVPSAHTVSREYTYRRTPVDTPRPRPDDPHYDDCVAGGRLFQWYCGSCHNARPLSERPFGNYEVAVAHMRDQAYLTGKEYRQIIHFLRRWHDVGPPTPDTTPAPRRLVFPQPIAELRPEAGPAASEAAVTR